MTQPLVIAEVAPLEYATATPLVPRALLTVARQSFIVSILSGLCVAVCFLPALRIDRYLVVSGQANLIPSLIHLGVFAVTIVAAIGCGLSLRKLEPGISDRTRWPLESIALLGLAVFAVTPLLSNGMQQEKTVFKLLPFAFGALAISTWRHVPFYGTLARYCRLLNNRRHARTFTFLGWFKAIYEGVWLACCFAGSLCIAAEKSAGSYGGIRDYAIYFMFGALFGVVGFSGVWVWMMISHGLLLLAVRRVRLSGREA